jgi:autonomous glycyl radical cofactor GrcA
MEELIRPGYKVVYGDYNSEVFPLDKKKAEALCDAIKVNYVDDQQGLRIVRVQDVRTVEVPIQEYPSQWLTVVPGPYVTVNLPDLSLNGGSNV